MVKSQLGSLKLKGKVQVHYDIYCKRIIDGGNVRSIIEKFVLDGLVESHAIEEDNVQFVVEDSARYHIAKDNFRCEVEVKKYEGKIY